MANNPHKCFWCHRERYLMPKTMEELPPMKFWESIDGCVFPEGVCGACCEDPEYLEHLSRVARTERINLKYPTKKRSYNKKTEVKNEEGQ